MRPLPAGLLRASLLAACLVVAAPAGAASPDANTLARQRTAAELLNAAEAERQLARTSCRTVRLHIGTRCLSTPESRRHRAEAARLLREALEVEQRASS